MGRVTQICGNLLASAVSGSLVPSPLPREAFGLLLADVRRSAVLAAPPLLGALQALYRDLDIRGMALTVTDMRCEGRTRFVWTAE